MLVNVGKLMSHTSTKGGGGVKHPFNPSLVDAWFMSGLSNSDKPTQIVGVKKNKLQLKNFAYALNSGFGEYATDFNSWAHFNPIETTSNKIMLGGIGFRNIVTTKKAVPELKILVSGFKGNIAYKYKTGGSFSNITINDNGVYTLPASEAIINTDTDINRLYTTNASADYSGMTIELLPTAYEGALVFDGVDDVAYIENFDTLIGEEQTFTVIANYTVLPSTKYSYNLYFRNNNSNIVRVNTPPSNDAMSGIRIYTLDFKNNRILYKNVLDNEVVFTSFTASITPNIFSLNGFLSDGKPTETSTVAYDWIAIYRGSLTPEEIEEEKVKLESEWEGGKNELA